MTDYKPYTKESKEQRKERIAKEKKEKAIPSKKVYKRNKKIEE